MSYTCPKCGFVSHHPMDEKRGYCGRCHEFTSLLKEGDLVFFQASNRNAGPMTINGRRLMTLHYKDGSPLRAGDLKAGQIVTYNRETGEINDIQEADDE